MTENSQKIIIQHEPSNGLATAGLVMGILGVVLNLIPFIPYIFGVLAIIFGVVGMKGTVKTGVAKAALILGIVTISLKFLFWIFIFFLGSI
ncbi:DUF4190 domain-containing protein [Evansella sp. AB-rgal1]|uniref:DUF4190 domain-containing protein n=1 Tax=Evansella sp. AB-rgal1 TaxID=3242696 RepID=UPI00359D7F69